MATVKIPYLIAKPGRLRPDGSREVKYFWQPSGALRKAGWPSARLAEHAAPDWAHAQAMAEAAERNRRVEAWKAGAGPGPADDAPKFKRVQAGTLSALVRLYKADRAYLDLRAKTRDHYDYTLAVLEDRFGAAPTRALEPAHFKKLYRLLARDTPVKAAATIVMARTLFKFAAVLPKAAPEYVPAADNPAVPVAVKASEPSGLIWPRAAIDAFVAAADRMGWHSVGTAVTLNEWLGQREGDLLRLPRDILGRDCVVVRQSKRGKPAILPYAMVPHLVARIERELAMQARRGVAALDRLLLNERTGRPWNEYTFRHVVADIRDCALLSPDAGFEAEWAEGGRVRMRDLWFMHLRHTAVTRMAEAGCSVAQMSAITRHSEKSIQVLLERYLVRTKALAAGAFQLRIDKGDG